VSSGLTASSPIAAVALAAHARPLVSVWFGRALALITRGILVLTVGGVKVIAMVPVRIIRTMAFASTCDLKFPP